MTQHFGLQEPASSPNPPTSTSASGFGLGIVLILLGVILGQQILRPRQPQQRSPERPAPLPEFQPLDPAQLAFTQALQWLGYGKQLEKAKNYEAAIAVYDQGLIQHPQDFRLWHERGLALAKLLRFEDAIASYDRAYQIRPDSPDLAHERGDSLLQLERFDDAIASLDIYLRYHPDNAHVLSDRGYALYRLGRYEDALKVLDRVLQHEFRDQTSIRYARYYQIETLRKLGRLEAAFTASEQALKRYPDEHFKAQHNSLQQQLDRAL